MTEEEYIWARNLERIEIAEHCIRLILPLEDQVSDEEKKALCAKLAELRKRSYKRDLIAGFDEKG